MKILNRSRRAFWGDVRFLTGILLVLVSIVGVWLVISSAGSTVPILQASRTITEGEVLASNDFRVAEVSLGSLTAKYLAPQDLQPGSVATRTITSGELVPASAATSAENNRTTTIIIDSSTSVPEGVTAGTVIEVWHAPPLDDGRTFDTPRLLVANAVVAAVVADDSVLAGDATGVEVVIDRAEVAEVLAAITGGSTLAIVPIGSVQ